MSSKILECRELTKTYVIGSADHDRYATLRGEIVKGIRKMGRWVRPGADKHSTGQSFDALHNVSFDVKPGERIGLLGHNGAGKSTLLKIFSRITPPTRGSISLYGRVASLLEVGTGFHGELTGRENIYLNGALLGMKRHEIHKHFDSIVDFSETEKFLDTPVKRYSTGMYTRLAFAVAAHLESEILLIDEVLAVGDVAFQEKCLGRISELSQSGRTVFFVSHNMSSIAQICQRGLLLEEGRLTYDGPIHDSISKYLESTRGRGVEAKSFVGKPLHPKSLKMSSEGSDRLRIGRPLEVELTLEAQRDMSFQMAVIVADVMGSEIFWLYPFEKDLMLQKGQQGRYRFSVPKIGLYPGTYWAGLWLGKGGWMDEFLYDRQLSRFIVEDNPEVRYFPNFKTASVKTFSEFDFKELT